MALSDSHPTHPTAIRGDDESRLGLFAWAMYDWACSAFSAVIQTFVFAAYFAQRVAQDATTGTTQWGHALGAAGALVAVGGPILGAVADQGGRRKPWIALFTAICVAATAMLWFVKPDPSFVIPALVLVAVATVSEECAVIFYNAMLPTLTTPRRMGRWSGWAWGLGYFGGLVCLAVALGGFVGLGQPWFDLPTDQGQHVRATFLLAAGWYGLFALPLFFLTPDTPSTGKPLAAAVRDGLRQLGDSIRQVRRYAPIARFLVARMIFIDGLATVFAFGGIYAAGTFHMTETQILLFGIGLNLTAGLGAAAFAWVDDWIGGKRTILISLVGLIVPGTAMLLVRSQAWFWGYGLILGVFVGPVQAAGRSWLGRMAPAELRNQMFGLYALSGKATAFAGPLLVGTITAFTGSTRAGMSIVVVMFALGLGLMLTVPSDRQAMAQR
ncbi:MAG TPA: MFS transporter [Phycisphaeraceae bacterium]